MWSQRLAGLVNTPDFSDNSQILVWFQPRLQGVYFGWAQVEAPQGWRDADRAVHKMVMNVGRRPTVNEGRVQPPQSGWMVGGRIRMILIELCSFYLDPCCNGSATLRLGKVLLLYLGHIFPHVAPGSVLIVCWLAMAMSCHAVAVSCYAVPGFCCSIML